MTRPPNDRGQGRKPLPDDEVLEQTAIRLTRGQKAKLAKLAAHAGLESGSDWMRRAIDRAKLPGSPHG
jgi:hypothetical protein